VTGVVDATPIVPYRNRLLAANGLLKDLKTLSSEITDGTSNTIAVIECVGGDERSVGAHPGASAAEKGVGDETGGLDGPDIDGRGCVRPRGGLRGRGRHEPGHLKDRLLFGREGGVSRRPPPRIRLRMEAPHRSRCQHSKSRTTARGPRPARSHR